jgi:hypothetical protein
MQVMMAMTGRTPLVQHNAALLDPSNPITQEISKITKKRNKTEADYAEVARLEWFGGLYHDPKIGIYVPASWVNRSLERAGTITRQGTMVGRAVTVMADRFVLEYDGPREPAKLWEHEEFRYMVPVGVQRSKVMRMRPIFRQWKLSVEVFMLENVLDFSQFQEIARLAGRAEGIGDARRLGMGRFEVEVVAA